MRSSRSVRARVAMRRTASSPKMDSSSLVPTTPLPPAIPASIPVMPPVRLNAATMSITAAAFTPRERKRARLRLSAPSSRIISSTEPCQRRICSATAAEKMSSADCTSPLASLPFASPFAPAFCSGAAAEAVCGATETACGASRRASRERPARLARQRVRVFSEARAAASSTTAWMPLSRASSTFWAAAG